MLIAFVLTDGGNIWWTREKRRKTSVKTARGVRRGRLLIISIYYKTFVISLIRLALAPEARVAVEISIRKNWVRCWQSSAQNDELIELILNMWTDDELMTLSTLLTITDTHWSSAGSLYLSYTQCIQCTQHIKTPALSKSRQCLMKTRGIKESDTAANGHVWRRRSASFILNGRRAVDQLEKQISKKRTLTNEYISNSFQSSKEHIL